MSMSSVNLDISLEGMQVLVDPLRARIVRLLVGEQLCTCHLVEELGVPQPTVSYHLKALREAGVVAAEPAGRFTYYRLRAEALEAASDLLGELADDARRAGQVRRPCA